MLIGSPNVNDKSRVRFAYGQAGAVMPVALDYICVNAECAAVQKRLTPERLTELRELTQHGLEQVHRLCRNAPHCAPRCSAAASLLPLLLRHH